jgi:hypothetical protein
MLIEHCPTQAVSLFLDVEVVNDIRLISESMSIAPTLIFGKLCPVGGNTNRSHPNDGSHDRRFAD